MKTHRHKLLAMVHIAKKQLGLSDSQYLACLSGFNVTSAADLQDIQLGRLLAYFKHLGWKPRPSKNARIAALRYRIGSAARQMQNWEKRLPGLTKAICGVDRLQWCRDEGKLKKLLAVIGKQ